MKTKCLKCENQLTEETICCGLYDEQGNPYSSICLECHQAFHEDVTESGFKASSIEVTTPLAHYRADYLR